MFILCRWRIISVRLALGANVWNMAFYGCFIGSLIWKLVMKKGMTKGKIILASLVGCILTLQLGAFSVTLETLASGITELPFGIFVATMQPIHLAIGLVEGLITATVLCFIYEARPEMLWNGTQKAEQQSKFSYKTTIAILACLLVIIGGGISLLASSNPDGLEWSIEQITGDTEVEGRDDTAHETAESIQSTTSFLPDYTFKDSESTIGTSVSGIVGCAITIVFLMVIGYIVKIKRNKGNTVNEQN